MVDFKKEPLKLRLYPLTAAQKKTIDKEIRKWKANPSYIPVIPIPVPIKQGEDPEDE